MAKLNFQQPLLQASVSHDPSEIILTCWFDAQETFLIIMLKTNSEEQHLKKKICCNIVNVFTVTFDQCNASLLI